MHNIFFKNAVILRLMSYNAISEDRFLAILKSESQTGTGQGTSTFTTDVSKCGTAPHVTIAVIMIITLTSYDYYSFSYGPLLLLYLCSVCYLPCFSFSSHIYNIVDVTMDDDQKLHFVISILFFSMHRSQKGFKITLYFKCIP